MHLWYPLVLSPSEESGILYTYFGTQALSAFLSSDRVGSNVLYDSSLLFSGALLIRATMVKWK